MGVLKFAILVDPSLVITIIYLVCLIYSVGVEKKILKKNNAFSLYDLYGHALAQEPLPRGHEIYNFGRPFLCHYNYILSLSDLCLGVEKKILKK